MNSVFDSFALWFFGGEREKKNCHHLWKRRQLTLNNSRKRYGTLISSLIEFHRSIHFAHKDYFILFFFAFLVFIFAICI